MKHLELFIQNKESEQKISTFLKSFADEEIVECSLIYEDESIELQNMLQNRLTHYNENKSLALDWNTLKKAVDEKIIKIN
jgi:hypothetical protein